MDKNKLSRIITEEPKFSSYRKQSTPAEVWERNIAIGKANEQRLSEYLSSKGFKTKDISERLIGGDYSPFDIYASKVVGVRTFRFFIDAKLKSLIFSSIGFRPRNLYMYSQFKESPLYRKLVVVKNSLGEYYIDTKDIKENAKLSKDKSGSPWYNIKIEDMPKLDNLLKEITDNKC